jgi:hypothetical protein
VEAKVEELALNAAVPSTGPVTDARHHPESGAERRSGR